MFRGDGQPHPPLALRRLGDQRVRRQRRGESREAGRVGGALAGTRALAQCLGRRTRARLPAAMGRARYFWSLSSRSRSPAAAARTHSTAATIESEIAPSVEEQTGTQRRRRSSVPDDVEAEEGAVFECDLTAERRDRGASVKVTQAGRRGQRPLGDRPALGEQRLELLRLGDRPLAGEAARRRRPPRARRPARGPRAAARRRARRRPARGAGGSAPAPTRSSGSRSGPTSATSLTAAKWKSSAWSRWPNACGCSRRDRVEQAEHAHGALLVLVLAGQGRQAQQPVGGARVAGGDRVVLEVLAPGDELLVVGRGLEEAAALLVGEALDHRVGERARLARTSAARRSPRRA